MDVVQAGEVSAAEQRPVTSETPVATNVTAAGDMVLEAADSTPLPIDWRTPALVIIALAALLYTVHWAAPFIIAILVGIFTAYALRPAVDALSARWLPRALATLLVMGLVVGVGSVVVVRMVDQADSILEQVPVAARKLSRTFAHMRSHSEGTLQKMETAATELQRATEIAAAPKSPAPREPQHVVIEKPTISAGNLFLSGSVGMAKGLSSAITMLFLVFFLLNAGDSFRRKLVRMAGPRLSSKKITVHILEAINSTIQRYLLALFATNVCLGVITGLIFLALGIDNATAWGFFAGLMHFIPYVGTLLTAVVAALVAFVQFDSLLMAAAAGGATLFVATVIGLALTTWLTGRVARMNATAVFVSLLFFGWLWGIWGALLAAPIMVVLRVCAEHVEGWSGIAELLSE